MVPVSLAPSTLNTKVVSAAVPLRPGTCAVHFPVTSAAEAANAKMPRRAVNRIVLMQPKMVLAGAEVTEKNKLSAIGDQPPTAESFGLRGNIVHLSQLRRSVRL
jgi:hypothetical protein